MESYFWVYFGAQINKKEYPFIFIVYNLKSGLEAEFQSLPEVCREQMLETSSYKGANYRHMQPCRLPK